MGHGPATEVTHLKLNQPPIFLQYVQIPSVTMSLEVANEAVKNLLSLTFNFVCDSITVDLVLIYCKKLEVELT